MYAPALDNRQCTVVDRDRRSHHDDRCALSVLDIDPGVIDDDGGAGRALKHDAAGRSRHVVHSETVLQRRLESDAGHGRRHDARGAGARAALLQKPPTQIG
jgi:hypothetical protein